MTTEEDKKRPEFICKHCGYRFELTVFFDEDPVLLKECPDCGKTTQFDIRKYQEPVVTVLKGDNKEQTARYRYILPDVITGSIPDEEKTE